jgi:sulfur carrier protein
MGPAKGVNQFMPIEIVLNGETRTAPEGQTVLGLLQQLNIDPSRVAIELDRRILKQSFWAETVVSQGAEIEIVQFVGGG